MFLANDRQFVDRLGPDPNGQVQHRAKAIDVVHCRDRGDFIAAAQILSGQGLCELKGTIQLWFFQAYSISDRQGKALHA